MLSVPLVLEVLLWIEITHLKEFTNLLTTLKEMDFLWCFNFKKIITDLLCIKMPVNQQQLLIVELSKVLMNVILVLVNYSIKIKTVKNVLLFQNLLFQIVQFMLIWQLIDGDINVFHVQLDTILKLVKNHVKKRKPLPIVLLGILQQLMPRHVLNVKLIKF